MGEVDNRRQVLQSVFQGYDETGCGEMTAEQLQRLHGDMRMGGVSLPQVKSSMRYVCVEDCSCDISELCEVLLELDRRYYLVQDLRWEFSMLDRTLSNTISEDQAKWLVQAVHGKYFSNRLWEKFLISRLIPGAGVSFAEIEVMLCDIPNKQEVDLELKEAEREKEAKLKRQQEIEQLVQQEKENELRERARNRLQKEQEEKDKHKRQLEEEERLRREEAEHRRKQEAEEEAAEAKRLADLEEHQRLEEARRRAEEDKLYHNVEELAEDEARKEKQAEQDLHDARQRKQNAQDARQKKEAESDEKDAAQRKTDHKRKRIRYDLKVAIKARDKFQLQHSIKEFSDEKLSDHEMELVKAERLLRELTAGDNLKKAMTQREIKELEDAMETVKKYGLEANLAKEMIAANKILGRLRRLERIRHEILELKQATVAEIRSYQNPPAVVHTVMTCTFLLLGHAEKETKNWKAVQALVGKTGKESLKRRCLGCDPGTLSPAATARAKVLLEKHELDEVRDVSAGAATFYIWSITMIEEAIEVAKQKEEDKLHPKEEKTTVNKAAAAPSSGPEKSRTTGPAKQRQSRSRSTGATRTQRNTSKTPERNLVQEKMNKVAAARRESEEVKKRQSEEDAK